VHTLKYIRDVAVAVEQRWQSRCRRPHGTTDHGTYWPWSSPAIRRCTEFAFSSNPPNT